MVAETTAARHVLHVIVPQREGSVGGADLHVLDLAKQQRAMGWKAWVLAPRASHQYARLLSEAGLDLLTVPLHRIGQLAGLPRKLGIDVVHAHGYESNYLLAALRTTVPAWRQVAAVTTAHGWIESSLWLRTKSMLDRLTARSAHVRIASARAHAHRMWTGRGENYVVHNGVPVPISPLKGEEGTTDVREPLDSASRRLVVGSVGRLSPEKRVDLFLLAAAKLVDSGHDVRFLIVGGGAERSNLEELVTELNLNDRVTFTGLVDDPGPYYAEMNVLVQASDTEGTPRTVIEAMARQVPVVATRVGDVAEILEEGGEFGLVVPPGDADALAEAVGNLLSERGLAQEIAKRAESRYQEKFTIDVMTRQVGICYESAIQVARKIRHT